MESRDTGKSISNRTDPDIIKVSRHLQSAKSILVFTGAGISADSGVPTFREAQSGLWAKYNPQELASPEAFKQDPRRVLDWYQWRIKLIRQAAPNPGHYALVDLEEYCDLQEKDFFLITQNIDNLHHQAGSRRVIELHGNIFRTRCQQCSQFCKLDLSYYDLESSLPKCSTCGGLLRPDVVWFGEPLQETVLQQAWDLANKCDLFFSIGTSALVQPAASLPSLAVNQGAILIEINPESTSITSAALVHILKASGQVLPELVAELQL